MKGPGWPGNPAPRGHQCRNRCRPPRWETEHPILWEASQNEKSRGWLSIRKGALGLADPGSAGSAVSEVTAPQLRGERKLSLFSAGGSGGGDSPLGRDGWPLGPLGAELGKGRGGLGQTVPVLRFFSPVCDFSSPQGPSFSLFSHSHGS